MKLPIQSKNIIRNSSVQAINQQAVYPSQLSSFPFLNDLHWCYGWDELTNTCRLYLGTAQSCASLPRCPRFTI